MFAGVNDTAEMTIVFSSVFDVVDEAFHVPLPFFFSPASEAHSIALNVSSRAGFSRTCARHHRLEPAPWPAQHIREAP